MCPGAVVILLVRAQHMPQMPLAEHDHMVEALASDRADQSFSVTVLPRRSRRRRSVANAHRANAARKCLAVDTVAITNEVVWCRLPPAGLADLPGYPFGGGMRCDAKPHNSPPTMSENEQSDNSVFNKNEMAKTSLSGIRQNTQLKQDLSSFGTSSLPIATAIANNSNILLPQNDTSNH